MARWPRHGLGPRSTGPAEPAIFRGLRKRVSVEPSIAPVPASGRACHAPHGWSIPRCEWSPRGAEIQGNALTNKGKKGGVAGQSRLFRVIPPKMRFFQSSLGRVPPAPPSRGAPGWTGYFGDIPARNQARANPGPFGGRPCAALADYIWSAFVVTLPSPPQIKLPGTLEHFRLKSSGF